MSLHSEKHKAKDESRALRAVQDIQDFLARKLPPGKTTEAAYLTNALLEAGMRYDRYTARKDEWWSYVNRRTQLKRITTCVDWLEKGLCGLDIISRDDFGKRVNSKEIDALVGSLRFLSDEMTKLANGVQKNGRPRDLAEERWILEVLDIYENAFRRPARIGPPKKRGTFYDLLQLSRPTSYPQNGKLSLRQIDRMLKRRKRRQFSDLLAQLAT